MSSGSTRTRVPFLHTRPSPLRTAATVFLAYTGVMLVLERRMRRSGGPGIIPFELAGDATTAAQIMTRWGAKGQQAARWSLRVDFGYMLTYGTLSALLVDRARRRRGDSALLPLLVVPAVAADAVEGLALLKVLRRHNIAINARLASVAAIVKFAILFAAIGYSLVGPGRRGQQERR